MSGSRKQAAVAEDAHRPSIRRTSSLNGPTLPSTPSTRRLSMIFSKPAESKHPNAVVRSNTPSDGSKRRIVPVPGPLSRANSASGGSMSRKQAAAIKAHPSGSRYSNKSIRDDHPKGDEPYTREDADVEIEELRTRVTDHSTAEGTRHGSLTRQGSVTMKKAKSEWTITKPAGTPPPLVPSPSKLRTTWASSSHLLNATTQNSAPVRLACWLGVFAIDTMCMSVYTVMALIHAKLPHTKLGMLLPEYSPELLNVAGYAKCVCVVASILAVTHLSVVIRMIRQSIVSKQLMYYAPNHFVAARVDHVMPFGASMKALVGVAPATPHGPTRSNQKIITGVLYRSWWVLQELLWARRELLVLNYTPPSERMYRFTLLCQTFLHIYEATVMSQRVCNSSLHQFYIACIVVNAWLPFLLTLLRNSQMIQWQSHRIVSVLSSITLDAFGVLVLRVILVQPYMAEYDHTQQSFPASRLQCDRWLVKMLMELHFVLAMDVVNTLVRIALGLHLLSSLNALKSLLESATSSRREIPSTERSISGSPSKTGSFEKRLIQVKPGNRRAVLMEIVLVVGGLIPIIADVKAHSLVYPPYACPLTIRPWFTTVPFCPLAEMNCANDLTILHGGGQQDLANMLKLVDIPTVRHLVVRSCPAVEISTAIHTLSQLLVFKVLNSTLVSWPAESGVTNSFHSELRLVALGNVTTTTVPPGLLTASLPHKLTEIDLCGTNISSLPAEVAQVWSRVTTLVLELSELDQMPPEVLQMHQLKELSLAGNNITSVPRALFEMANLETLYLNGNPITMLPPEVDSSVSFIILGMDSTLLVSVPTWASAKDDLLLLVGNTPYCENVDAATLPQLAAVGVNCTPLTHGSMTLLPLLLTT